MFPRISFETTSLRFLLHYLSLPGLFLLYPPTLTTRSLPMSILPLPHSNGRPSPPFSLLNHAVFFFTSSSLGHQVSSHLQAILRYPPSPTACFHFTHHLPSPFPLLNTHTIWRRVDFSNLSRCNISYPLPLHKKPYWLFRHLFLSLLWLGRITRSV